MVNDYWKRCPFLEKIMKKITLLMAATMLPVAFAATFGSGDQIVNQDIKPGTYRSSGSMCIWQRLKGFSGNLEDVIASEISQGSAVVTIKKSDKGFTSSGCATWTDKLSPVTKSKTASFGDGTFIVNVDIAPGTWSAKGEMCIYQRLSGFGGTLDEVIASDIKQGRAVVSIKATDKGFKSSGCGKFTKL
jgi:hypothetical protein